ncbi:hypothetical protein HK097_007961 [Rhizophlyctis rosea]|uniref:Phosphatidate cytidylyltransferase n=1 Tax=Rhizophlyctis rosea TaxID=64517 RepID=A0AAD5SAY3_9FUNG|nr:hypothetical protein HK097_007961 [Rhizophlyctis rosea]
MAKTKKKTSGSSLKGAVDDAKSAVEEMATGVKLSARRGSDASLSGKSEPPLSPLESPATPAPPPNPDGVTLLVDESKTKKWRNAGVRGVWTFVMIGGFFAFLMAGHIWVVLLVGACQALVYKEVISIGVQPAQERKLPWNRFLHWYFLGSTNYFLYGESIIHYFKSSVIVDAFLIPLATHHRFISFLLYCFGLVLFVLNLKKGHYKFQFSQFGWTHMTLLLVVCTSHFIINNIFEGLFWFVVPICLVVCNDIMAYVCGFFWGRTPLIRISPKKTWEGFIGSLFLTTIFAFFFTAFLAQFPYMYCPLRNITTSSISGMTCVRNPVFEPFDVRLPRATVGFFRHILPKSITPPPTVPILPIQLHAIPLALFASLVAPFGGFFASGFKRAFKIKDFGDSIPGHGGITDRMDCQFLMGLFSYMYYQSFIGPVRVVTVGTVLDLILRQQVLSNEEVGELVGRLREYLVGQGEVDPCTLPFE